MICDCLFPKNLEGKKYSKRIKDPAHYSRWNNMLRRCYEIQNRSYRRYGGRGILVCFQWVHKYENFVKDIGERPSIEHSLDRRDNNKGYCPHNIKWSTRSEQTLNRNKYDFTKRKSEIGIKGVTRNGRKFSAHIRIWDKKYFISLSDTPEEAGEEYKKVFKEWWGFDPTDYTP